MSRRHLRDAGISDRTLRIYRREVSHFFSHLRINGIRIPRSYATFDETLAAYINHLYQEGEALTRAGWVLSGFKRLYPRVRRELPTAQQWYNNWARQHLPKRATPITWSLVQSFMGLSFHLGWHRLCLCWLIGFVFFLRTNELLSLDLDDIQADCRDGSVVIRIATSKTSPLAQQIVAHTDPTLALVVRFLKKQLGPCPKLWTFSSTFFPFLSCPFGTLLRIARPGAGPLLFQTWRCYPLLHFEFLA